MEPVVHPVVHLVTSSEAPSRTVAQRQFQQELWQSLPGVTRNQLLRVQSLLEAGRRQQAIREFLDFAWCPIAARQRVLQVSVQGSCWPQVMTLFSSIADLAYLAALLGTQDVPQLPREGFPIHRFVPSRNPYPPYPCRVEWPEAVRMAKDPHERVRLTRPPSQDRASTNDVRE